LTAGQAGPRLAAADRPAHWAQLDAGSAELVRRARGYLDEIAPLLPAAERDRALPVGIIPAARLLDNGADARVECSMSKYFCSEAANQVATRAVQVFGAAGLMGGNVAERLFRDAREATIGEGTSQMQVLQIGKALLGVSAVR